MSSTGNEENEALLCSLEHEHERMLEDIAKHGHEKKGEHKGICWSMRRPGFTYWCGYVEYKGVVLSEDDYEKLERLSHGGLTCGIGFDCAHGGDYAPFTEFDAQMQMAMVKAQKGTFNNHEYEMALRRSKGIFRDHDYVMSKIHAMIDYIVSVRSTAVANAENV